MDPWRGRHVRLLLSRADHRAARSAETPMATATVTGGGRRFSLHCFAQRPSSQASRRRMAVAVGRNALGRGEGIHSSPPRPARTPVPALRRAPLNDVAACGSVWRTSAPEARRWRGQKRRPPPASPEDLGRSPKSWPERRGSRAVRPSKAVPRQRVRAAASRRFHRITGVVASVGARSRLATGRRAS